MKAYKIYRVKDGRLFSSFVNDRACIKYSLRKESTGKTFLCPDDKKIWRPIFAYKNLTSARNMKAKLERNMGKKKNLSFHYEIWEVEGQRIYKKFLRGCIVELEYGRYYPAGLPFSSGIVFLSTCTPIRRVDVS